MKLTSFALATLVFSTSIAVSLQGCAPAMVAGGAGAASIASDKRTAGTIVEDQAIEYRLASKLQADDEMMENTNINVTSYNGVLLVTGEAPTQALKDRVQNYAAQDTKVKRTYNEIVVRQPLPYKARNYDTWLTTKAKTKLLTTKDISSVDVKIVTSDTTVYLMGLVTRKEADLITQSVSQVQGITRIVKAFEYIEPTTK